MSKDLKRQLTRLKELHGQINPDRSWVSENRKNLLSQISNTVNVEHPQVTFLDRLDNMFAVFAPEKFMRAGQPLIVALLAVTVTVGGWIAGASAAYNSIPGDTMYGVKIAAERTQVAIATVTGDKKATTQLHIEFATRRSEEVKKVVEKSPEDAPVLVEKTMKKLKDSIETAKEQAKTVGEEDNVEGAVLAKDLGNKTIEIAKNLQETAKIAAAPVVSTDSESEETKKVKAEGAQKIVSETVEAKKLVNDVSLDVLKTAVEKTASEPTVSETVKKDIVDLVKVKIETLSEDVIETQKESSQDLTTINQTKNLVTSKKLPVTTTTKALVTQTASSTPTTEQKIEQVTKKIAEVEEKTLKAVTTLEEAKALVTTENLVEAIEKAKEVNQAHGEIQKQVQETKSVVKEVVLEQEKEVETTPVVPVTKQETIVVTTTPVITSSTIQTKTENPPISE